MSTPVKRKLFLGAESTPGQSEPLDSSPPTKRIRTTVPLQSEASSEEIVTPEGTTIEVRDICISNCAVNPDYGQDQEDRNGAGLRHPERPFAAFETVSSIKNIDSSLNFHIGNEFISIHFSLGSKLYYEPCHKHIAGRHFDGCRNFT
jgi:hypothetical protein